VPARAKTMSHLSMSGRCAVRQTGRQAGRQAGRQGQSLLSSFPQGKTESGFDIFLIEEGLSSMPIFAGTFL
jgi:hypothetical protein